MRTIFIALAVFLSMLFFPFVIYFLIVACLVALAIWAWHEWNEDNRMEM